MRPGLPGGEGVVLRPIRVQLLVKRPIRVQLRVEDASRVEKASSSVQSGFSCSSSVRSGFSCESLDPGVEGSQANLATVGPGKEFITILIGFQDLESIKRALQVCNAPSRRCVPCGEGVVQCSIRVQLLVKRPIRVQLLVTEAWSGGDSSKFSYCWLRERVYYYITWFSRFRVNKTSTIVCFLR